ncbi:MAG: hypothetical protein ABEH58_01190 [Haloplanus sp.]
MPALESEPADGRTTAGRRGVSRRTFLALAALVGADVTATGVAERERAPSPADVVLRREDLASPRQYVEWSIRTDAAALPQHLTTAIEAFVPGEGAMSGFLATDATDRPTVVESAVFPDIGMEGVVSATDEWIHRVHDNADVRRRRHEFGVTAVQWETAAAGEVDVLRVERIPGSMLAFVGVSGLMATESEPRSVVARHANTMRGRAAGRRI